MGTSRVLPNNVYSPYFTPYTFILLISPCGFLSSIHSFVKKNITADCCRSGMRRRFKTMVIKFTLKSFYFLPVCGSENKHEKIGREGLD